MRTTRSVSDTPDARLDNVEAALLIWFFFLAEAALALLGTTIKHARRIVYLFSSEGVGDDLEQQRGIITAHVVAAKLLA